MESFKILFEAAYPGNLGFEEMMRFFQKASEKDVVKMQKIVKDENWEDYKKIIKKVLGVSLK